MFDWTRHQVCLAEGPDDAHVLLAIRPERVPDQGGTGETVVWDDGDHRRAFPLSRVVGDEPAAFSFQDDRGRRFALKPLTAKLYRDRVRGPAGGPELATDEEVRDFYLAPRSW